MTGTLRMTRLPAGTSLNLARCANRSTGVSGALAQVIRELPPTAACLGAFLDDFRRTAQHSALPPSLDRTLHERITEARALLDGRTTPFAKVAKILGRLATHVGSYPDDDMRMLLSAMDLTNPDAVDDPLQSLMAHVDAHAVSALHMLADLVAIPSISDDTTLPNETTFASAARVLRLMIDAGFQHVELLQADRSNPTVYGEIMVDPELPTVMCYAHHDVQPVNSKDWHTPPFEAHLQHDRLYGRGAADDKAGFMAALAAVSAYRQAGLSPPCNILFFIEGEEESASPNLGVLLRKLPASCKPDVVLLTDSDNPLEGTPMVTLTTRGAVFFRLTLTPVGDTRQTALNAVASLVARCTDRDRCFYLPNLTHRPTTIPPLSRESLATLDPTALDEMLRTSGGMFEGARMVGDPTAGRPWRVTSPFRSLQIVRIHGSKSVQEASGVIIPKASALLRFLVPPGKTPRNEFRRFHRLATVLAWPGTAITFPEDYQYNAATGEITCTVVVETATHETHCGLHSYVRSAMSELMWIVSRMAGQALPPRQKQPSADPLEPMERVLFGFSQFDVLAVDPSAADGSVTAALAFRVPPGFSAKRAYARFQRLAHAHARSAGMDCQIGGITIEPWAGDTAGTTDFTRLLGQALTFAYGKEAVFGGSGGSIGFFEIFGHRFPKAVMLRVGIEDPHTHAHGPNESLSIEMFLQAARGLATFFTLVRQNHDTKHGVAT